MTTTERTGIIPVWTLADKLRKARMSAGFEQPELADKLGISRQSVSNYERGFTTPNKPVIYLWAVVCGVDHDWLAGDPLAESAASSGEKLPRLDSNQQPAGLHPGDLLPWPRHDCELEPQVMDSPVLINELRQLLDNR